MFTGYQVEFRSVKKDDIEQLRYWRNRADIRLMMLDQREISPAQQSAWFENLESQVDKYHFSLWFRDQLIGYANAELTGDHTAITGLYIGHEKYRGSMLSLCVGVALSEWCFDKLPVKQICVQVAAKNYAALRFNETLGYRVITQQEGWVYLAKTNSEFNDAKVKLARILSRFS